MTTQIAFKIMNNESDDEIINVSINYIYNKPLHRSKLSELKMIPDNRKKKIYNKMFIRNLILKLPENLQLTGIGDGIELSNEGIKAIVEYGDYLSFLKHKNKQEKLTNAKIIIPIIIAVAALIWAVISGIMNYTKGKEIERKDLIIKTQSETIDKMKR